MSYTYNQFCHDTRYLERAGDRFYLGYKQSQEKKLVDNLWKEFPQYAERYSNDEDCYYECN